ncbi:hypothetical protein OG985_20540 [Streptomyces sp. NBC_00289]|uniref:hypothetical protein n=1 Tax=Streptomyces sp. NBC_00289 TaxID=2975703 RepID=UPI00324D51E3
MTDAQPPEDYRLLVPRDWFRIDLTLDRWRPQLKKFVDQQVAQRPMSAEAQRELWTALRNTAESGVAQGSLELFLRTEASVGASTPATLLISLLPMRGALNAPPKELAESLAIRRQDTADVSVTALPAGNAVRVSTTTTLDYYVYMPGEVGYLLLAFTVPLSGVKSPMGELCEAIAASLRWV